MVEVKTNTIPVERAKFVGAVGFSAYIEFIKDPAHREEIEKKKAEMKGAKPA